EVAVDDPPRVQVRERVRDATRERERIAHRQRPATATRAQGLPLEPLGDQVGSAVFGFAVRQAPHHGRLLARAHGPRLACEAVSRGLADARQYLDRDPLVGLEVPRAVDGSHAPRPRPALYLEPATEHLSFPFHLKARSPTR